MTTEAEGYLSSLGSVSVNPLFLATKSEDISNYQPGCLVARVGCLGRKD